MKARIQLAALAIAIFAVAPGCDGPTGPAGPAGPAGPPGAAGPPGDAGASAPIRIASNSAPATDASSAAWAALAPQVTITSVTIASPPVVKFKVTDAAGTPVLGLGNTSKSSTATVAGLTNLAFSLAKLVPGTTDTTSGRSTSPSKWVSYIVTTVPTTTTAAAPTRPSTDNTGTLTDNGDGTYAYTFYRDVKTIKDAVAAMTVTAPNDKADLGDLTYDATLVHRLTLQLSGNAPGTGTNTPTGADSGKPGVAMAKPVDAIYNFTPSNGQTVATSGRDIVATQKCNECHRSLGGIPGDDPESSGAGFHGGNRNDAQYCVVCHTEQRKYGRTEATQNASTLTFTSSSTYRFYDRAIGNFPNQIHHIHAGPVLAWNNYNYGGVLFNEVLFPQDLRNCTKCHDGSDTSTAKTAQGDNWKIVPSRLACGGCHDGIDFATGMGVTLADAAAGKTTTTDHGGIAHTGGAQPDDRECSACHVDPTRPATNINSVHLPVTPPNPQNALVDGGTNANTNSAWIASNPSRLPEGAIVVSYDIKSVSLDGGQPVMVFRLLQNGARTDLNDFNATAPNPATGQKEIWDNFMGAPSLYFVFAEPQDGISAPADFNATASVYLKNIWKVPPSGGTLTGPDADGYYTGTLTAVSIPSSAVMLTGGVGYSYSVTSTLPLTQTNLPNYPVSASLGAGKNNPGGLIVIAPNAQKVATGFTGRRPIVEDARCNACHQELGTFTEDAFHAGQRNDGTTCSWCHNPNRASSGWSADSASFIHAIHAGAKREVPFTWHASSTTESFADVKFPGVLKDCETCHLPGTYDFSASASDSAVPNRLYRTVMTGILNRTVGGTTPTYSFNSGSGTCVAGTSAPQTAVGAFALSPYFTSLTNYGFGYAFNAGLTTSNSCKPDGTPVSILPGGIVDADSVTLVNSPISTACFACHDSAPDQAHMELNGGAIYGPRSTALNSTETCLICHGTDRIADIKAMHAK